MHRCLYSFIVCFCGICCAQSLSLPEALERAKSHNPHLLELEAQVNEAKQHTFESLSKYFPKIAAKYQMFLSQVKNPISDSRRNFLTQLHLTQDILSTKKYYDIALSRLNTELIDTMLESARNDITYKVRSLYYKAISNMKAIEAAEEHVMLLQQLAQQMKRRLRIGTAKEYDVNQTLVAVANASQTYYRAVKEYKNSLDALAEVLGMAPDDEAISITQRDMPLEEIPALAHKIARADTLFAKKNKEGPIFAPDFFTEKRRILSELYTRSDELAYVDEALAHNPALSGIATQLKMAEKSIKQAYGSYLPHIAFEGRLGGEPDPFEMFPSSRFDNQSFHWGAGISLQWTLFDSFGRESRIAQAKYKRDAHQFKLEHQKQRLTKEVRDAIHSIEESIVGFVSARSNTLLAEQTLEQAKQQLEVGYIDIFDYQISINGYISAKSAQIAAAYDVINAYFGLENSIGTEDGRAPTQK